MRGESQPHPSAEPKRQLPDGKAQIALQRLGKQAQEHMRYRGQDGSCTHSLQPPGDEAPHVRRSRLRTKRIRRHSGCYLSRCFDTEVHTLFTPLLAVTSQEARLAGRPG